MSPHSPETSGERHAARVTDLELLFTHLQRDLRDLHESILWGQQRLESLDRRLAQLERQVTALCADEATQSKTPNGQDTK